MDRPLCHGIRLGTIAFCVVCVTVMRSSAEDTEAVSRREFAALLARVSRLESLVGVSELPLPPAAPLTQRLERLERELFGGQIGQVSRVDAWRPELQRLARSTEALEANTHRLERRLESSERQAMDRSGGTEARLERQIRQLEREIQSLRQDVQRLSHSR